MQRAYNYKLLIIASHDDTRTQTAVDAHRETATGRWVEPNFIIINIHSPLKFSDLFLLLTKSILTAMYTKETNTSVADNFLDILLIQVLHPRVRNAIQTVILFKTDNSLKLVQTVQCREFKIKAQNYC
jgi:hypothetical protein